ncbi:helix-turn-helix domain-containing protein [Nocardia abscessus]
MLKSALRAQIAPTCEGKSSNSQIVRELGVSWKTITRWRNRFARRPSRLACWTSHVPAGPARSPTPRWMRCTTDTLVFAPHDATH